MRKIYLTTFFAFLSIMVLAQGGEWINLFNGKNFKGWTKLNGTAEYRVENGEIVGISATSTPNTFLATEKIYGDFILEYEMKMDAGLNSGVQIRSLSKPDYRDGRVHGYQIECDDSDRAWSGGIFDEARRGWLYPMEYNQAAKKAFKKDEWNSYRVEAIGSSIRTWLNGVPCANLIDELTPEGFIALQVHSIGDKADLAGKTIRWRNIRIKTAGLAAESKAMPAEVTQVSYLNNRLTEREKADGWKLLWDGETNTGWRSVNQKGFPEKGWSIENGELIVNKGENKGGGDIATVVPYTDFILEADFLYTPGANSGIKYFIQEQPDGTLSNVGCEFQILDDEKHPDAKMGVNGNRTIASLYDLIPGNSQIFDKAQPPKRNNGANQWNRARIVVRGETVIHYLNGVKTVEYTRGTQVWKALVSCSKYAKFAGFGEYKSGHILLQDHQDEVHFRNLKIKVL